MKITNQPLCARYSVRHWADVLPVLSELTDQEGEQDKATGQLSWGVRPRQKYRDLWEHVEGTGNLGACGQKGFLEERGWISQSTANLPWKE